MLGAFVLGLGANTLFLTKFLNFSDVAIEMRNERRGVQLLQNIEDSIDLRLPVDKN